MRIARCLVALSVALVAGGWSAAAEAQSLAACGDIHVEASAMCKIKSGVLCESQCTPVSVRAACAADLAVECAGGCDASFEADCQASCTAGCMGTCEVDPGKFDCRADCQARCDGNCQAKCEGSADGADCVASCEGTCAVSCDSQCDIQAPSASCMGQCEASCQGSCTAEANLDCQIDCQAEGYAECKVDVEGGCKVDCQREEGALFCDGQYVDHDNNLDECVGAIQAWIDANVEGYADGSAECSGNSCVATGSAGASCAALPGAGRERRAGWALCSLLGLTWAYRRRR